MKNCYKLEKQILFLVFWNIHLLCISILNEGVRFQICYVVKLSGRDLSFLMLGTGVEKLLEKCEIF